MSTQSGFDFQDSQREELPLEDGRLTLYRHWLSAEQSCQLFEVLNSSLAWEQSVIQIYGKSTAIPRLNAWYGDEGAIYQYSGYQLPLHSWTEELQTLRLRLQRELGVAFNSLLANLYRNGQDSVGWHSDNEPELGPDPIIATVSLGAERRFSLRRRGRPDKAVNVDLPNGSLLVMGAGTQRHWQHCVRPSQKVQAPRISLTYRNCLPTY